MEGVLIDRPLKGLSCLLDPWAALFCPLSTPWKVIDFHGESGYRFFGSQKITTSDLLSLPPVLAFVADESEEDMQP